ncbi:MAG: 2-haloacrylate reductase [Phycisphaerales bacterium]|nr:2-haloacrylate reductase [Phycisphaerales bacterium]
MTLPLLVGTGLVFFSVPQPAAGQPAATMHAVRIHQFGGPEVLTYEQAPRPVPATGEVLIRIHAAGVNPVDWKIVKGGFGAGKFPMIVGYDVSGVVDTLGEAATRFRTGDEVFAYLPLQSGGGYAEYVCAPEMVVSAKPKTIDHVHAAAVPLAALTAWQALFDTAKLEKGQTVLIHGGAGGVGHFAVQLAKWRGATVITTASAPNHEFLKELGADQVIDYKTQKFEDVVKDVDVVFDTVGGETRERSYGVIKKGGFFVSIVGPPAPDKLKEHGIRGKAFLVQPNGAQLAEIAALIDSGALKPTVSHVFPLDQAGKAHEQSQTGHTRGKIVLEVVPRSEESPTRKP